ncbi:nucleoside hydrolase [Porticoccus sp. W117]|uniref:nucleoside hydrolase n=1 Tax=Porticoccus sp. W117 TaxID=3054777 RepID=UPI0025915A9C|nr:nucleoside hydrolase [Porticoccus sp. W117]MDM3872614.1 nucleoside hydrolase [Porticoccus sp. W117]
MKFRLLTQFIQLGFLMVGSLVLPAMGSEKPKIIVDADLYHYADDHEAIVMLSTLHNRGALELLGLTLVAGNHHQQQNEVDSLRLIERMKIADGLPVYLGADRPLLHSREAFHRFNAERYGSEYAGAWSRDPSVVEPVDGMPTTKVKAKHAVTFIIDAIRANPDEVTIVALGPLTNIALAFRMAPDISSKIKSIIYMGGTAYAPGNVTPSAEFNWWFDAEAAKIVLEEAVEHVVIPLDATDKILFNQKLYKRFVKKYPNHPMTTHYLVPKFKKVFKENPDYTIPVWDALVPVYLYKPNSVTDERELWLAIDAAPGPNYGRVIPLPVNSKGEKPPFFGAQKAKVIITMNEQEFWKIYEELVFEFEF